MRFLRRSLVGLFLLSVTIGLLSVGGGLIYGALQERWSDAPDNRPARERMFSVNVIAVEPGTLVPVLTSFGEIQSRRTLDIRAPIGGRVMELAAEFDEGARVEQGQLLARIDPADAQTSVDVALTDLREAEADLRQAERALILAGDELQAAENQATLRKTAMARQNDLLRRGVGTDAAVEAAELAASTAEQAVLSRWQALQQVEARIDQSKTLIERRRINLANARRLLADTEIFAPFDGVLSDVTTSAGGLVSINERMASLIDPEALDVSFRVSTAQYTKLIDAQGRLIKTPVKIVLEVLGTEISVTGRLTRESASVFEGTTGRLLFAELDAASGLRPGDFVSVEIPEPPLENVVMLPNGAVDAQGDVLVLGPEDRLEETRVAVLRRQGDGVIIEATGLAGREVVAERSQLLGPGIKVRPIRQSEAETVAAAEPDLVELTDARRAELVAYVQNNTRLPDEVRARMLRQLAEPRVPARMVERIEARMGS